jgi:crossover junction endodeoxyribonuclease RuvC
MSVFIGIDPGKTGGYSVFNDVGDCIASGALPIVGDELDILSLLAVLKSHAIGRVSVAIEKVGAMPGQGVSSMFKFGKTTGMLIGAIMAMGWSLNSPVPVKWQKETCGQTHGDKDVTASWVMRMFPNVQIVPPRCRKYHEGIVDAVGIGYWLWKTNH